MNPPRTAAALALTLALLAGCGGSEADEGSPAAAPEVTPAPVGNGAPTSEPGKGGGSGSAASAGPSAGSTTTGTAAPSGTDDPATAKTALALADAGVLVPADMPGFTQEPVARDASDEQAEEGLYTCLRARRPTYVARNPGAVWTKANQRITASADVLTTAKAAKQDVIASKSGLAPTCFREYLIGELAGSAMSVSGMSDGVPVTVKGADSAFAVKVTISAGDGNTTTKYVGYLIGAAIGAVRVTMLNLHTDGTEPTLAEAAQLTGVAVNRVKAAQKT